MDRLALDQRCRGIHSRTMTPAGLEPAIPGSVGRCLIHWATGPIAMRAEWMIQEVTFLIDPVQLCDGATTSHAVGARMMRFAVRSRKLRGRELNPGLPRDRRKY
jgi:hypothetical protein